MRNFRASPNFRDREYFVTEGCGLQGDEQTNLGPINIRGLRWDLRPPYPFEAAARALAPSMLGLGFLDGTARTLKTKKAKKLTAAQAKKLKALQAKKLRDVGGAAPLSAPGAVALPVVSGNVVEYTGSVPPTAQTKTTLMTAAAIGLGSILLLFRRH